MIEEYTALVENHRNTGMLLDSNLMLVLLAGGERRDWIGKEKRLKNYAAHEFDALESMVTGAELFVTPNIATEVSNLVDVESYFGQKVLSVLHAFLLKYEEKVLESRRASAHDSYMAVGLTDAGLMILAADGVLVLTDDLPLAQRLEAAHLPVINFTLLRNYL